MPTKKEIAEQERAEALDTLRGVFPPGSTAKTILRHVTRSGMSRSISLVSPDCADVTYLLVRAGLGKFDDSHGGIKQGGCGTDMGFGLVYSMSRRLYPDGFECIGINRPEDRGYYPCPSNDHSNARMFRERGEEVPKHHSDGGYAVSQRWL